MDPVLSIFFSGVMTPSLSAPIATNGFTIDPGVYNPDTTLFKNGFPLLIIANDIHGEVLNLLALNKAKANFPVVAIRAPYYGDTRREFVEDIALTTGATIISSELQEFAPERSTGLQPGFY